LAATLAARRQFSALCQLSCRRDLKPRYSRAESLFHALSIERTQFILGR
jgi:hypothetical protein